MDSELIELLKKHKMENLKKCLDDFGAKDCEDVLEISSDDLVHYFNLKQIDKNKFYRMREEIVSLKQKKIKENIISTPNPLPEPSPLEKSQESFLLSQTNSAIESAQYQSINFGYGSIDTTLYNRENTVNPISENKRRNNTQPQPAQTSQPYIVKQPQSNQEPQSIQEQLLSIQEQLQSIQGQPRSIQEQPQSIQEQPLSIQGHPQSIQGQSQSIQEQPQSIQGNSQARGIQENIHGITSQTSIINMQTAAQSQAPLPPRKAYSAQPNQISQQNQIIFDPQTPINQHHELSYSFSNAEDQRPLHPQMHPTQPQIYHRKQIFPNQPRMHPTHPQILRNQQQMHPTYPQILGNQPQMHPTQPQPQILPNQSQMYPSQPLMHPNQQQIHPTQSQMLPNQPQMYASQPQIHHNQPHMHPSQPQMHPNQQQMYPSQPQMHPNQQQTYPSQPQMHPNQQQTYPSQPQMHPNQQKILPNQPQIPNQSQMHPNPPQIQNEFYYDSPPHLHTTETSTFESPEDQIFLSEDALIDFKDDLYYTLDDETRGLALGFITKHMCGEKRQGAEADDSTLSKLFESMGVHYVPHHDMSRKNIKYTIASNFSERDIERYSMFFLVFSTHGDEDHLYDSNHKVFSIYQDILPLLKPDVCKHLEGKPKIILVQACRGDRRDSKVDSNEEEYVRIDSSEPKSQIVTLETDFLIAYSCVRGYVAHRHIEEGSWFLEAFYKIYTEYGSTHNFRDLLILTNRYMLRKYSRKSESGITLQPCQHETTFRKFLKIIPTENNFEL